MMRNKHKVDRDIPKQILRRCKGSGSADSQHSATIKSGYLYDTLTVSPPTISSTVMSGSEELALQAGRWMKCLNQTLCPWTSLRLRRHGSARNGSLALLEDARVYGSAQRVHFRECD
ncbi:hypothetical protein FF1_021986 [Malus domestica]